MKKRDKKLPEDYWELEEILTSPCPESEDGLWSRIGREVAVYAAVALVIGGLAMGALWVKETYERSRLEKTLLQYGFEMPSRE